jgi:CO/xanthine dehydrogenase FAD-binding subunit
MVERHTSPLSDEIHKGVAVSVTKIPELHALEVRNDKLVVGAAVSYLTLRNSRVIAERCAVLAEMSKDVGAVQIQARGTLGGNLVTGSPAADGVTALFALDARVVLVNTDGERQVPITEFYTGYKQSVRKPDELVTRFVIDLSASAKSFWRKVGTRSAQSIAKASICAFAQQQADGTVSRIGFGAGSVAERVLPLQTARNLIQGQNVRNIDLGAVLDAVSREIRPIDDIRSTARYRRHLATTLVSRFLQDSLGVMG